MSHEAVIAAMTAEENQIKILEDRIRQLEDTVVSFQEPDNRRWNHRTGRVSESMGISDEQALELGNITKFWYWKSNSLSEVLEKIEVAPVRLREKIFMVVVLVLNSNRGGGPGGPGVEVHDGSDFFRFMMEQIKRGGD